MVALLAERDAIVAIVAAPIVTHPLVLTATVRFLLLLLLVVVQVAVDLVGTTLLILRLVAVGLPAAVCAVEVREWAQRVRRRRRRRRRRTVLWGNAVAAAAAAAALLLHEERCAAVRVREEVGGVNGGVLVLVLVVVGVREAVAVAAAAAAVAVSAAPEAARLVGEHLRVRYIALRCIALHYITLHCVTFQYLVGEHLRVRTHARRFLFRVVGEVTTIPSGGRGDDDSESWER